MGEAFFFVAGLTRQQHKKEGSKGKEGRQGRGEKEKSKEQKAFKCKGLHD